MILFTMLFSRFEAGVLALGMFLCGAAGAAQQPEAHPAADAPTPATWHVTVPAEGGLIFKMKVNGQGPYRTIFDTGAVNVMSANFAKQLGLKVEEGPVDFGAIGGSVKARTVHVDSLMIGKLIVKNQMFYVLEIPADSGTPEMLVGWEFMHMFAVQMDFEHNELTFFEGPSFKYTGKGEAVPLMLHKNGNGIDVAAKVDGIPAVLLLDSGNQLGFYLNSGFVNEHHLVEALGARYRGYNGKGFGGPSPEAWITRLHRLKLGAMEIAEPVVRLQTADDGFTQGDGNIGQSILNHFLVTVDCLHGMLYLERYPDWNKREIFNRAGIVYDPVAGVDEVKTVFAGSPAEAAGLKPGDGITAINGKTPSDDPDGAEFKQAVGAVLHLTVRRGDLVKGYDVTLRDVL